MVGFAVTLVTASVLVQLDSPVWREREAAHAQLARWATDTVLEAAARDHPEEEGRRRCQQILAERSLARARADAAWVRRFHPAGWPALPWVDDYGSDVEEVERAVRAACRHRAERAGSPTTGPEWQSWRDGARLYLLERRGRLTDDQVRELVRRWAAAERAWRADHGYPPPPDPPGV
jgi:hypothetical protein